MPLATVPTKKSVSALLNSIENEERRKDSKRMVKIIQEITGEKPKIWGENYMIGFGKYTYRRKGSKEDLEWFNVGFAPRKDKLSFYITCYLDEEQNLLDKLGKHTRGKACLHIKRLADIDVDVLKKLIKKHKDAKWY